jgi:hypothetical protein
MKTQKLIVIAAIVCLLVGASGAAIAQEACAEGILSGTEEESLVVDGDIIIDGRSCFINNVNVSGDVTVTNSEDLSMVDNRVAGNVRITEGRNVTIIGNTIGGDIDSGDPFAFSDLVVSNNRRAAIYLNIVTDTIAVINNNKAEIKKNVSFNLFCFQNRRLDENRNETANLAGGVEDCKNFDLF